MNTLKNAIKNSLKKMGLYRLLNNDDKYASEKAFWENELASYIDWYNGELPELYGEPSPTIDQKIAVYSKKDSAILTWGKTHQQTKYLQDLDLQKGVFSGLKILDIGAGPYPSASAFEDCEIYCLDPLLPSYLEIGFPIHYFDRVKFINAKAEIIPVQNNYFDAIISVNALDHVDNFLQTSKEIKRVIKTNGKIRLHLHYHKKTIAEPIELNDQIVIEAFEWCKGFKKINESKTKRGYKLENIDEVYTLWSNF